MPTNPKCIIFQTITKSITDKIIQHCYKKWAPSLLKGPFHQNHAKLRVVKHYFRCSEAKVTESKDIDTLQRMYISYHTYVKIYDEFLHAIGYCYIRFEVPTKKLLRK